MGERERTAGAPPEGAAGAVAALWPTALPQLLDRVIAIEDAVAALLGGELAEPERESVRREAHRLAGSLGAFGVAQGSVLARELETRLAEPSLPMSAAPELADRVLALRRAVESGPAAAEEGDGPRVVLAGLTGVRAGALLRAAAGRGWRVTAAPSVPPPGEADVVLLDGGVPDLPAAVGRLAGGGATVGVLAGGDLDRVALVRAGAQRLVPAALEPAAIVEELALLCAAAPAAAAATILAVDDDPVMLELVRTALEGAGQRVETCADPAGFWTALEESRPDLVMLDVEMPEAAGPELCRALRADPRWRDVPVLFLTATTEPSAVAGLFAAGADDYVPKPVEPGQLAARVARRLARAGGGTELDRATGFPRRAAAEPELERLLALARRLGQPLSVAALALDGFAALAPEAREAGLAAAGRAAQAALPAGDAGAAWGGGALVLAMLGADEHAARAPVEAAIAAVREAGGGVTASAGIAERPRDGDDLAALVGAASAARRAAEAEGGDRVSAGGPAGGTERVDVALVEDDTVLAGLILETLQTRGYRTHWISDGDVAAERLGGARPALRADLVLLDWDLPARDGPTVLRGLAADGVLAGTRVVMLTARASQREILTALELGATEHVAKPFSLAVLVQRVERVLGR